MVKIPKFTKSVVRSALVVAFLSLCGPYSGSSFFISDPEEPLPFITESNDGLLDQIFEEEKSDRVCRFLKSRKLKT